MRIADVTLSECGGRNTSCRSVSWNSNGNWLAMGGQTPRIWAIEGTSHHAATSATGSGIRCTEVLVISGHSAPVERIKFHPKEPTLLCTAALDATVRLWDIRAGAERPMGRIDLQQGKTAVAMDWNASDGSTYVAVTERGGGVFVYDVRKLGSGGGGSNRSSPLSTFRFPTMSVDACVFSPAGKHLVAATTRGGMSDLRIWSWKVPIGESDEQGFSCDHPYTVPAHTGPIDSLAFSPDGKRVASGGSDAIAGIWDVASMTCTATVTRRLKPIRGIAFSHDSQLLGCCSDEDGVDVSDVMGADVGVVSLRDRQYLGGAGGGGADEIAFNPNPAYARDGSYLIACGRTYSSSLSAAVVAKVKVASQ